VTTVDVRPLDAPDDEPPAGDGADGTSRPRRAAAVADRLSRGAVGAVLLLIALFWLVPTIGLAVSSLRDPSDINSTGWWTVLTEPAQLTFENYQALFDDDRMTGAFWNTVLITVPSAVLVVLVAAFAAYAFAWMDFPGRDALFLVVIGLLVVPIQVALVPVARLYADLGIYGELIGVIMFHVAFGLPFAIFLLRNFFVGIPRDLLEAARMDGAGELTIFFRVILPLGLPAIASLLIFQFLWVWNDLLVALVFADSSNAPLTRAIQEQTRQFGSNLDVIAPGAFFSMIVPLAVFFAFQRYFVQGLLAGSVK
jgi:alpha-glucoside transport system permease protein